ncbi:CAP domain-containing protein [Actinophytocola glycyrrhizae]|uniref:CAP domain-containing protein n=1 Tax=Actinophytocola glycyrrhizae TaxID=2044873 RepID=A0ABV9S470_9PSEU
MLPTLTAVLAGALVAGTATMLANPAAGSSADQDDLSIGLTDEQVVADSPGDLVRPTPGSARPSGSTAPTSTPTTSSAPSTTSSTTTEPPAPPPPPTTSEEPPAPPPTATGGTAQDQVVSLVNTFRGEAGCGPVSVDAQLTAAAQGHAEDMSERDYFSHTSLDGRTFDQRIRNAGYPSPGAENIARGARTAERVMQMWMESDGHRRNILNCDLATIGVGLERDGFYWVQNFGF